MLNKYGLPCADQDVSEFYGVAVAITPTHAYLDRLFKCNDSSLPTFVVMVIVIQLFGRRKPTMQPKQYNVQRVTITALVITCNAMDIRMLGTLYYSRVGCPPFAIETATWKQLCLRFVKCNMFFDDIQCQECVRLIKTEAGVVVDGNYDWNRLQLSVFGSYFPYYFLLPGPLLLCRFNQNLQLLFPYFHTIEGSKIDEAVLLRGCTILLRYSFIFNSSLVAELPNFLNNHPVSFLTVTY